MKYQTSGFSSGGFPASAGSLIDGEYAYWFRLYNPDAAVGGPGPIGPTGAITANGGAGDVVSLEQFIHKYDSDMYGDINHYSSDVCPCVMCMEYPNE